jgi:hypothetical protein
VKIKIIIAFIAIVGMLGLAGCKPKTTILPLTLPAKPQPQIKLTGQMFIVTEGAENVKLGDVEAFLIKTAEATNFLQKKQTAIETVIQSRKQALEIADAKASEPHAEYELVTKMITTMNVAIENADKDKDMPRTVIDNDLAVAENDLNDLNLYFTNSPYVVNNDFATVKRDGGQLLTFIVHLARTWSTSAIYVNANRTTIENDMSAITQFEQQLNEIARSTKEKYDLANSSLDLAKTKSENSPTPEDYMADFLPTSIQKTITDADGKFSFVYPSEQPLTIFAHAQRMVGTKTEQYYWLINAPTNTETIQIFLSDALIWIGVKKGLNKRQVFFSGNFFYPGLLLAIKEV